MINHELAEHNEAQLVWANCRCVDNVSAEELVPYSAADQTYAASTVAPISINVKGSCASPRDDALAH